MENLNVYSDPESDNESIHSLHDSSSDEEEMQESSLQENIGTEKYPRTVPINEIPLVFENRITNKDQEGNRPSRITDPTEHNYWLATIHDEKWSGKAPRYAKGMCGQWEIAPTTGKKHAQVFICYSNKSKKGKMAEVVRSYLPYGTHVEAANPFRNATLEQKCSIGMAYCTKDDTRAPGCKPWRMGVLEIANPVPVMTQIQQEMNSGVSFNQIAVNPAYFGAVSRSFNFLRNYPAILKSTQEFKHRFELDKFLETPMNLSKPIVLVGRTGIGKTAWALAHFKNPLIVSHKDDFKLLNPSVHDGLVCDDMDFTHWPVTSQIHLVDMDYDRTVDVKHSTCVIPANFPRIFTCNPERFAFNDDPAINRRINIVRKEHILFALDINDDDEIDEIIRSVPDIPNGTLRTKEYPNGVPDDYATNHDIQNLFGAPSFKKSKGELYFEYPDDDSRPVLKRTGAIVMKKISKK